MESTTTTTTTTSTPSAAGTETKNDTDKQGNKNDEDNNHDDDNSRKDKTVASTVEPAPLHDGLALGGFEMQGDNNNNATVVISAEEQQRLPLLLRILSEARPLSSIPSLLLQDKKDGEESHMDDDNDDDDDADESCSDRVIQQAVDRLEDRAALYSAAEGVELVACQLAPFIARKMSKLKPLQRQLTEGSGSGSVSFVWQTDELELVASNPLSLSSAAAASSANKQKGSSGSSSNQDHKRRKLSDMYTTSSGTKTAPDGGGGHENTSDVDDNDNDEDDLSDTQKEDLASRNDNAAGSSLTTLAAAASAAASNKGATTITTSTSNIAPTNTNTAASSSTNKRQRESLILLASEDSQEATVTKTLSELALLVVACLKTAPSSTTGDHHIHHLARRGGTGGGSGGGGATASASDAGGGENDNGGGTTTPSADGGGGTSASTTPSGDRFLLATDDSVLAEAQSKAASVMDSVGSAMIGCDLASTVACLMHHTPVLHHSHVAMALCRAAVPQAANMIAAMGANCPAAVPCLLRGCVAVHAQAQQQRSSAVMSTARQAVLSLADLSTREASRIRTVLYQQGALLDVQLELAARHDSLQASLLVIQHLSSTSSSQQGVTKAAARAQTTWESQEEKEDGGRNNDTNKDGTSPNDSFVMQRSLQRLLETNPSLLKVTLMAIAQDLQNQREQENVVWNRIGISLAAMSWLLYRVSLGRLLVQQPNKKDKVNDTAAVIGRVISELQEWAQTMRKDVEGKETKNNTVDCRDRPFSLLMCATMLALASTFPSVTRDADVNDVGGTNDGGGNIDGGPKNASWRDACLRGLSDLLECTVFSHKSSATVARFVSALGRGEMADWIESVLRHPPTTNNDIGNTTISSAKTTTQGSDAMLKQLSEACEFTSRNLSCDLEALFLRGTEMPAFVADPSAGLDLVREVQTHDSSRMDRVEELLRAVLDESSEHAPSFLRSSVIPYFVEEAAAVLQQRSQGATVPLVLPIQMEMFSRRVFFRTKNKLSVEESHFMLCLLYCFLFSEGETSCSSPFVFDPRELPLHKVRCLCETLPAKIMSRSFRVKLVDLMDRHCPEVVTQARLHSITRTSRWLVGSRRKEDPTFLLESFRQRLKMSIEQPESDPSGMLAERAFLSAREELSESSLFTTTASIFMAEPSAPPRYYTFASICRDPLLLLKCPTSTWNRKCFRRIVLSVLGRLLEINDHVTKQVAPSEDSRVEFLDSRNELLVRCLVHVLAPSSSVSSDSSGPYCSMSLGLVRKTVAKNHGLLAMMLKQGLPESAVDYIVEWVPECMEDSLSLGNVLSERNSLTTAERLVAADAILRMALAHGQRVPEDAKSLVFSALSQLLASFFLIIGPTGVPVNTLVGDGTGIDATHLSRKAAFRMLKALMHVQSYMSQLRGECVIAMQKLVGLCKGESIVGSASGAIAARQKGLIKELLDSVLRASNAMGSGLQV